MNNLIQDTLIWFGGFIAIAFGLLVVARKLTLRSRTFEETFKTLKSDTSISATAIEQAGCFGIGLPELIQSIEHSSGGRRRSSNSIGWTSNDESHGKLTTTLIIVGCGSLAGGVMWSLTSVSRSWLGVMIGLSIATLTAGLGLWLNSRHRTETIPLVSRTWAELLEWLAIRWFGAGPQIEMMRQVARSIEPHDPALAAFVLNSSELSFIDSPFGNEVARYQSSPWPESSDQQVQWFLETACAIRVKLAAELRDDAERVSRRTKCAIWMFLAPSLYLVLLTPPGMEMVSYFNPRPGDSRVAVPVEILETSPPSPSVPEEDSLDGEISR